MKKYRLKETHHIGGWKKYVIERRFWLFFWFHVSSFNDKDEALFELQAYKDDTVVKTKFFY